MSHRTKKVMYTMLALLVMITVFVGCSGGGTTVAPQEPPATSPIDSEPEVKPITFTAYSTYSIAGVEKWGSDPVSKRITELTGVSLDIEYSIGDSTEKIGVMLAAQDYPELFLSISNEHLARVLSDNAAVELDEYIDQYCSNIQSIFGDGIGAMRSELDGKIYGFSREFGAIPSDPPVNMQIQHAVLKEAGYPKINTLDEMLDLMKSYAAKYPEIDGKSTLGLLSPGAGWTFNIGFNNAALRTAGFQDDGNFYIDPVTKEATFGLLTPEAKDYFKWLNKVNREGLFDMDSFSLDSNAFNEKIATGRVMAISSPVWLSEDGETSLKDQGMYDKAYAKIPLFVSKEAAGNSRTHYYDPYGSWKSVITDKCKDVERAVQFFDTMWSEEMQVLCNWGIEGVNYTVDNNGIRSMKDEDLDNRKNEPNYRQRTGVQLYTYWSVGSFYADSTGQYIDPFVIPENEAAGYTDMDKEVLTAYNPDAVTWMDLFPTPKTSEWGFAWKLTLPGNSEGAVAEKTVNDEIRAQSIYKMVSAQTEDEFEKEWNDFVKKCEGAGIEKREEEITQALQERMKLWYGK